MLLLLLAQVALADSPEDDSEPDEEVVVLARSPRPGTRDLSAAESLGSPTLADALADADGVSAVLRGGSPEPVIRGLGGERVQTRVGGVPLYGSAPSRMDPPAGAISPGSVSSGRLVAGLPSVVDGPLTTGGAIEISLDPTRPLDAEPAVEGSAWTGWDSARDGLTVGTAFAGGDGRLDFRVGVGRTTSGDYRSAAGVLVPTQRQTSSGSLALGTRLGSRHRVWAAASLTDEADTAFPAIPMDLRTGRISLVQGGTAHELGSGVLRELRTRAGAAVVLHTMDNDDKATSAAVLSAVDSRAASWSAGVQADLQLGDRLVLTPGLDLTSLSRDAIRTREVLASQTTFTDALWPDTSQVDAGAFVQGTLRSQTLLLILGVRLDAVSSAVGTPDAASLGDKSVAEQWVGWYGTEAQDHDRGEWTGGGNAAVRWCPTRTVALHGGLGLARRAAGITERYFAFAPIAGGFRVGNPTLVPETRLEAEVGATFTTSGAVGRVAAFGTWLDDAILPTTLDQRDMDGDGVADTIQGYVNSDAVLAGADASVVLEPLPWLRIPAGAQWVVGRDRELGEPLLEIPPIEGHLAARATLEGGDLGGHVEVGARLVASQQAVSVSSSEDTTPGFALLRAQVGVRVLEHLEVVVAGENLLDADYHEHLSREAAVPAGDLAQGDEVPGPGRHLGLWVCWDLEPSPG